MYLPMLLLAFSMPGQTVQMVECSNLLDRRTEFHSSHGGVGIAFQVHAEDDHLKESHLCQMDYSLAIKRGDGASKEEYIESIDDSWDRPVQFWIDGFAMHGRRLIATIVEQGEHPVFQVVVYSLQSKEVNILVIPRSFLEQVSSSCRGGLRTIGMTQQGDPVVGYRDGACDGSTAAWKLRHGPLANGMQTPSIPIRLTDRSVIEPIEPGETSSGR